MVMSEPVLISLVFIFSLIGFLFAAWCAYEVAKVGIPKGSRIEEIYSAIYNGAHAFLFRMYRYMAIFILGFFVLLLLIFGLGGTQGGATMTWGDGALAGVAFVFGSCTSTLCGFLGMKIAVFSNARTAIKARDSVREAFILSYSGGLVMGAALVALGVLNLFIVILMIRTAYPGVHENLEVSSKMFEVIAAYGLGGSAIALFGRVGGGIYTKAADVGADLVGKLEYDIPEDDPKNPAVIADNVGDNVGDVAGMGADLFGSLGEVSCVALLLGANSPQMHTHLTYLCYPLSCLLTGMVMSVIASFLATRLRPPRSKYDIQPVLKQQLILSTILSSLGCFAVMYTLPAGDITFTYGATVQTNRMSIWFATLAGLWTGLLIGFVTEYYTSGSFRPVQEVAEASRSGAGPNIIYGLALGYKSAIIPAIALGVTIFLAHMLAGPYGIAAAAIGILSTLSTALAVDVFGPICDNAGGIAEMCELGDQVRDRTDALDAAGNTTAAIGKGFAIGSAALVSLALFAGFVEVTGHEHVDILRPQMVTGLLIGAMLPYWFSALTMKSVGMAAMEMVNEVRRQFRNNPGILDGTEAPDYNSCIQISTDASLREMIAPSCLVLFTPIITGFLFGADTLEGVIIGCMVSGVQLAVSSSNSGGAWDNAKKYISTGALGVDDMKGSATHKAAIVGDTVGDPMKDTSGPSLNILIKLIAIVSLVFGSSFPKKRGGYLLSGMVEQD